MANTYSAKGLTGKSGRKMISHGVSVMMAPVVLDTAVVAKANKINDTTKSGKQLGAMVIRKTVASSALTPCIATGSGPTDKWLVPAAAQLSDATPI